jgi:sugar/nucleoside kinase (ribokinase family)
MKTRDQIAQSAVDRLEAAAEVPAAVVGFDGFLDSILDAVDFRHDMSPTGYQPIRTIERLAQRIGGAAGKSMNLEIVPRERQERWGGNGPLLAGAMARLGSPVAFIGAVGRPEAPGQLHPLFQPFASLSQRVFPIAAPGRTLALEFDDGKVMLNETTSVQEVTWERVVEGVGGLGPLIAMLDEAALLGIVNWSLLGGVEGICRGLMESILPRLGARGCRVFVDLSDPAKRTDEDLAGFLDVLAEMNGMVPLTLGVNLAEAQRIGRLLGAGEFCGRAVDEAAALLRQRLGLTCVVVHRRQDAGAASMEDDNEEVAAFDSAFIAKPRISTGAGDHFNGGFALARMLDMPLPESLAMGCAVAGSYVREGVGPSRVQLARFLRRLPRPEPAE